MTMTNINAMINIRKCNLSRFLRLSVQAWKSSSREFQNSECENPNRPQSVFRELFKFDHRLHLQRLTLNNYPSSENFFEQVHLGWAPLANEDGAKPLTVGCWTESIEETVSQYALDIVDRLVDFLRILGFKSELDENWYEFHDLHYAALFLGGVWSDNLKYHIAWLFSYYEKQEFPTRSNKIVGDDGFLVAGGAYSFLRSRISGNRHRQVEARFTLLQGLKKSFLPLDIRKWSATLEDHKKELSKVEQTPPELLEEVRRTAREMRKRRPALKVKPNERVSSHANMSWRRCDGGFLASYVNDFFKTSKNGYTCLSQILVIPQIMGIKYLKEWDYRYLYSRYLDSYEDYFEDRFDRLKKVFLQRTVQGGQEVDGMGNVLRTPAAAVRCIPEPFKVRVISLGEDEVYAPLRPFQRRMWKTLQKFPCYSLTGKRNDFIEDEVSRLVATWEPGQWFLSGDYKASTDCLHSDCTKIFLEEFFGDEIETAKLTSWVLGQTRITYEDSLKTCEPLIRGVVRPEVPEDFDQVNGQLMGNPLSFPVLCGINAAICRAALEKCTGKTYTLDSCPMLINGDDCLLVTPKDGERVWSEMATQVGLTKSVGKSYFSQDFAMINSRYFWIKYMHTDTYPELTLPSFYRAYIHKDIGYINMGIPCGRKKGNHEDCEVDPREKSDEFVLYKFWQSAAANLKQMLLRVEKLDTQPAESLFLKNFMPFIKQLPVPATWPKEVGGLGLPSRLFTKSETKPFRWRRFTEILLPFAPCPGFDLEAETKCLGNWTTLEQSLSEQDRVKGFLGRLRKHRKEITSGTISAGCLQANLEWKYNL